VAKLVKLTNFCVIRWPITVITKDPPPVFILGQMNPIHTFPLNFSKTLSDVERLYTGGESLTNECFSHMSSRVLLNC